MYPGFSIVAGNSMAQILFPKCRYYFNIDLFWHGPTVIMATDFVICRTLLCHMPFGMMESISKFIIGNFHDHLNENAVATCGSPNQNSTTR